jgi:hypothetical protein
MTENESPKVKRVVTEEVELDQITMTLTDRDEEESNQKAIEETFKVSIETKSEPKPTEESKNIDEKA